jgi:hypothetical protein
MILTSSFEDVVNMLEVSRVWMISKDDVCLAGLCSGSALRESMLGYVVLKHKY